MDAVYPFLHMAGKTGRQDYLDAGIAVFEWSRNVSQENGAWTVIPDPKSWTGITVFGAIALAEALRFHGGLLPDETRRRWTQRLRRAADFIHDTFTLDFTNINYGATAIYGLHLFGEVLGERRYAERSRALASGVKAWFTQPNALLFGEGKPSSARSPRGLPAVDLGYNVEESLNGLALYALEASDEELIALVERSLASHLEFMLPDGAWDNSWGTRQAKWSYWGSRTTDGCQPAYTTMAHRNPVFGAAAYWNTHLLRRCTHDGFLHGGLHYASRGVKPCIHHTFAHAKALAYVLDHPDLAAAVKPAARLPRVVADGVKSFPEIAVWLASRGPWRATVSAYDHLYLKDVFQVTGGALGVVHHARVGPLLAGSMARYVMVERNNMQANPDPEDNPLTPRIEVVEAGARFTHLHDLQAKVASTDSDGVVSIHVATRLLSETQADPAAGPSPCELEYRIENETFVIRARAAHVSAALVIPLISPTGEAVRWISDREVEITKPEGTVVLAATVPLRIQSRTRSRVFNHVPGFEAVPFEATFLSSGEGWIECRLRVR